MITLMLYFFSLISISWGASSEITDFMQTVLRSIGHLRSAILAF
jgi:hypothetical protein